MKRKVIALSILVTLYGCSTANESGSIQSGNSSESQTSKISKEIPSDFPLPVYPGAKVIRVDKDTLGSGGLQTHVLTQIEPIKDSPETIIVFYTQKLQSNGWAMDLQTEGIVCARKGNEIIKVLADNHFDSYTSVDLIKIVESTASGNAPPQR
jgi:hypothetical protein